MEALTFFHGSKVVLKTEAMFSNLLGRDVPPPKLIWNPMLQPPSEKTAVKGFYVDLGIPKF